MKDERRDSKLRMLKIVFKTISKNYNPDRYGKIIEYLIENKIGLDALDDKLKLVCLYRKKYKEVSLSELSNIISIENNINLTKSGLNHRLRKIREIATSLK